MKLEIFQGRSGLEAIEAAWRELTCGEPASALTQIVEYYLAYVTAFELTDAEPFFATVKDSADRVIAILPLCRKERKLPGTSAKFLAFPDVPVPIRDIVTDQSGPQEEIIEFLVYSLGKELGDQWDYLHFRQVPQASSLLCVRNAHRASRSMVKKSGSVHILDVSKPGYIARTLNANARNNLRRNRNKMKKAGEFRFQTISTFPELETAYECFLTTEAAGWKSVRGGKRAVKLHADQKRFYYDLMTRLATRQRCHIHLLFLNDQPVASDYCVIAGDKSFSVKHGYDEAYSGMAPGNLLRAYTIDYYEEQKGVKLIDLVSGWDWQRRWRPDRRDVFDIKIFRRSLRGTLLYYLSELRRINKNQ